MDAVSEVLARDDARIAAMLAADGAALEVVLAADYTHAHNNGLLEDCAAYLASVTRGPVRCLSDPWPGALPALRAA